MSVLEIVALALGAVVVVVGTILLVGVAKLRRMSKAYKARVAAMGPAERSFQASFFGRASAGKMQARGLGTLLLTETELVFVQLMPARELRVARSSITSTKVARSFLGKTQGRDLLVVTWDQDGMGDAAAYFTPDIEGWRTVLDPALS